jgi:hypothetical protein
MNQQKITPKLEEIARNAAEKLCVENLLADIEFYTPSEFQAKQEAQYQEVIPIILSALQQATEEKDKVLMFIREQADCWSTTGDNQSLRQAMKQFVNAIDRVSGLKEADVTTGTTQGQNELTEKKAFYIAQNGIIRFLIPWAPHLDKSWVEHLMEIGHIEQDPCGMFVPKRLLPSHVTDSANASPPSFQEGQLGDHTGMRS